MNKKLAMAMVIISIGCFILLNGCAPLLQVGGGLIGESIGRGMDIKQKSKTVIVQSKQDILSFFKKPNNVVEIDKASMSEVWEYNNVLEKGKIKAFAFIGDRMEGGDSRIAGKYDQSYLREKYINLFPCYSHLHVDTITEHIPPAPATPPDIPITSFAPAVTPASY
ncbi:hypothetical protein KAU19_06535 [Candidatus Parcubacteria bacterium]|nr:hypothetical protein [Candidatus Parcubacteria bacterium]